MEIMQATHRDQVFCDHLGRKFSNALGPIRGPMLSGFIQRNWVTIAKENNQHAGFMMTRPRLSAMPWIMPIIATAVPLDLQSRDVGRALVNRIVSTAMLAGRETLQAWCLAHLRANEFWRAMGFVPVAIRYTNNARKIPHVCWRRAVDHGPVTSDYITDRKPRGAGGRWVKADGTGVPIQQIIVDPLQVRVVLREWQDLDLESV